MNNPTASEQIAWAAGLFEGEGSFNSYPRGKKIGAQARLAMTDRDAVGRFAAIVGGAVHPRRSKRDEETGRKMVYEWYCYRSDELRRVINLLLPWLCDRRRTRAQELLLVLDGIGIPKRQRTHCPKGHAYDLNAMLEPFLGKNGKTYVARRCRICRTVETRERARRAKNIKPENYRVKEAIA